MSQQQAIPVTQVSAPVTMSQQQAIPVTQISAPVTQSQQQPIPATQVSSPVTQSQQHPIPVTQVFSPVAISQQQPIPVTQVSSPVSISQHQPIPATQVPAPVTISQRQPVPVMQASAPIMVARQQSTPMSTPVAVSQQQPIANMSPPVTQGMGGNAGESITGLTDVLQWSFPSDFCQSSIAGRCGSNACTFIALYFGYLYLQENLPPPHGSVLSMEWKDALYKAMKRGNEIHDELFEGEGVDVSVEDAVSMAGMECFVSSIDQSIDVFGQDCEDQLASVFHTLASTMQSRCNAVVTTGRTLLFIINEDGSCMIVDSHKHQNKGALIAYCPSNSAKLLAKLLTAMLQETWQCTLRVCSVTPISYITP